MRRPILLVLACAGGTAALHLTTARRHAPPTRPPLFAIPSVVRHTPARACSVEQPGGRSVDAALLGAIGGAYWYLLVFGAAAAAGGLPVPEWLPLTPGWPPSEADLAPVLEDSANFFYIPDALAALGGPPADATLPALRIGLFNLAEAWVFALLPLLLEDRRRLPLWVVLPTWLGALGLTNAFLAPYLAARAALATAEPGRARSALGTALATSCGAVAAAVAATAVLHVAPLSAAEWGEFGQLCAADRTYAAFVVDLALFSAFQAYLMRDVPEGPRTPGSLRYVPFVGLVAWLLP
jgi:hypothetical protein